MSFFRPAAVAVLLFSAVLTLSAAAAIVSGTVSGSGGVRLAGKVVEAYGLDGILRGTASTDSAGAYMLSLPAGEYRLLAYDPQGTYATEFYPAAESFEQSARVSVREGSPVQIHFTLPLGGTIAGTVTAANAPLATAVVEVYNLSGSRRGFTRTNAAGEFSLVVPAGDYKLFAYDANDVYAGEFHANARTFVEALSVRMVVGNMQTVSFALDRAAHVSGSVLDAATRLGIPGMIVYAYTPDGKLVATRTTDAQGHFRFTLQGGQYRFVAGDPARLYGPSFWNEARSFARADILTLSSGIDRRDLHLLAERAAIIRGRVTTLGSEVVAYNLDGTVHAQATAGSFGEYTLVVAPGQYKLAAVSTAATATEFYRDTPDFHAAQVITVLGGQTLSNIDFDPPRAGRFTGTVRDAVTQQPLPGMTVAAYDAAGVRVAETTTRADGTYTLLAAPGEYRVVAFDTRLEYATSYAPAPRAIAVDATETIDFTMRRGTRVSGTVALANGSGIDGAEVLAFDLSGNLAGGATTEDGAFTIVVVPGTYTFVARTRFTSATLGPIDVGSVSPAPLSFVLEGSARRRASRH